MRVVQMNPSSAPNKAHITQPISPSSHTSQGYFLDIKNFKHDDWILLAIISALILDGSDDYLLICALGYLFLIGFT